MITTQPNQPPALTPERLVATIRETEFKHGAYGPYETWCISDKTSVQLIADYVAQLCKKQIQHEAVLTIHSAKLETELVALRTAIAKKDKALESAEILLRRATAWCPQDRNDLVLRNIESTNSARLLTPAAVADELAAVEKESAQIKKSADEVAEKALALACDLDKSKYELAVKDKRIAELELAVARAESIEREVCEGRHFYLQHEIDAVAQRAEAAEAKVAELENANTLLNKLAIERVDRAEARAAGENAG